MHLSNNIVIILYHDSRHASNSMKAIWEWISTVSCITSERKKRLRISGMLYNGRWKIFLGIWRNVLSNEKKLLFITYMAHDFLHYQIHQFQTMIYGSKSFSSHCITSTHQTNKLVTANISHSLIVCHLQFSPIFFYLQKVS